MEFAGYQQLVQEGSSRVSSGCVPILVTCIKVAHDQCRGGWREGGEEAEKSLDVVRFGRLLIKIDKEGVIYKDCGDVMIRRLNMPNIGNGRIFVAIAVRTGTREEYVWRFQPGTEGTFFGNSCTNITVAS